MSKFMKTFFTCLTISCSIYFLIFTAIKKQDELDQFKEKSAILNDKIDNFDRKLKKEIAQRELIGKIIACESSGEHDVWGDGGKAYGIVQYWESTFYEDAGKAGIVNPNWKNKQHQLIAMKAALDRGEGAKWSCWRKLEKKGDVKL